MATMNPKLRGSLCVALQAGQRIGGFVGFVPCRPEPTSLLSSGALKPVDTKGPYSSQPWFHAMNRGGLRTGRSAA